MSKYKIKELMPQYGANTARIINVPDEVVKQIRADAIEEFARELHKGCNEMIKSTWGSNTAPISWAEAYADFKVDIDETAEKLKEQK